MPQMTGLELIETARSKWPSLKVVLASGYVDLPTGAGDDLVKLVKPYRQEDLVRAIADTFKDAGSGVLKFSTHKKT